jgi:hypothetical protein
MQDQVTGDQIEAFFRARLKILSVGDRYDRAADEDARIEQRARDKAEWESLDEDSKAYLQNYLAGK